MLHSNHCVVYCIYWLSLMYPEATGCWCQNTIEILLIGGVPHPSPLGNNPSHYEFWVMANTFPLSWPLDNNGSRKWHHTDAKGQLGGWRYRSAASSPIHLYCPLCVTGRRAVRKLIIAPKAGGDTIRDVAVTNIHPLTGSPQLAASSKGHTQGKLNIFISICFHFSPDYASKSIHSLAPLLPNCVGHAAAHFPETALLSSAHIRN